MTDLAIETPSTVIDTEAGPSAAGGGAPALSEPVETPPSLREEIERAVREDKPEEVKPEKAELPTDGKEEKAPDKADEKAPAEKVEKPEKAEATEAGDAKPDADKAKAESKADKADDKGEGTKFQAPPKNFLPDSREVWRNVPRSVRRDIETMEQERESERQRFQEVSERYDRVRDFDELARSNGRDLRESLAQVHQFETLMGQNPVAALNMALREAGPRKADGQPVSLYEVAQHIVQQGPEGYQRMMQQAQPPRQQQEDPRVVQLQTELQRVKVESLAAQVIEPFKASHPRYDELADDIALFLQSGKISSSLSHADRLAAAYDMAERINPPSHRAAVDEAGPDQDRRAGDDFSGSKSIKSSPGSVTEQVEDQASSKESPRDSILKELRKLNRA